MQITGRQIRDDQINEDHLNVATGANGEVLMKDDTAPGGMKWDELPSPPSPPPLINFTTSEQDTGKLWVDGRPVYQKTINFGAAPNNTTKGVNHNISDLDYVIHAISFGVNPSSSDFRYIPIPFQSISNVAAQIRLEVTQSQIRMASGSNWSAWDCFVTLEYVKT